MRTPQLSLANSFPAIFCDGASLKLALTSAPAKNTPRIAFELHQLPTMSETKEIGMYSDTHCAHCICVLCLAIKLPALYSGTPPS